MGRGARNPNDALGAESLDPSNPGRVLHRARPDAGAVGPVGAAVRHAQWGGARRILLGEHGGGWSIYHRLFLLGVRRARLGPRPILSVVGRGRRSLVEP